MGGRLLWQFGAGRMVPPDTRNNVIEPSCLRDEFPTRGTPPTTLLRWRGRTLAYGNLIINQMLTNFAGTPSTCAS
jgi:hypothetical protein